MSLPDDPDERATLPVVDDLLADDELAWAIRDRSFLEREGIAEWDDTVSIEDSAQWVAGLGFSGVYAAHVRAQGIVYECPGWCTSPHPRRGVYDPDGDGPVHTADVFPTEPVSGVDIGLAQSYDMAEPAAYVYSDGLELDAAQLRQLAAALLNAADVLDAINGARP